jgi:hypothetical protein
VAKRITGGTPRAVQALQEESKRVGETGTAAPLVSVAPIMDMLNEILTGQQASAEERAALFQRFEDQDREREETQQQIRQLTAAVARLVEQQVSSEDRQRAESKMATDIAQEAARMKARAKAQLAEEKRAIEAKLRGEVLVMVHVPETTQVQINSYKLTIPAGVHSVPTSVAKQIQQSMEAREQLGAYQRIMKSVPHVEAADQMFRRVDAHFHTRPAEANAAYQQAQVLQTLA